MCIVVKEDDPLSHGHQITCNFIIFIVSSVTPVATAMVLLYRFYYIFVYHVLIIDLYFASWAAVRA